MANFFRLHSKNTKLTNEESEYIDNLLFSKSSPTKKTLPLFPRATPYGMDTPFTNSKYSSLSSTGLKSSRKRLEIFDKDLESFKPSFLLADEIAISSNATNEINNEIVSKETAKFSAHNPTESSTTRSPPRQMTDAAKELMANINMNVETYPKPQETPIHTEISPSFEFKIPERSLPEFHFDIFQDAGSKIADKRPEFKFNFDISCYAPSSSSSTHVPDSQLPKFHFITD